MGEKKQCKMTRRTRFRGATLIVAVIVVLAAMPASATTTYYRVTDLGPVVGVAADGVVSPLNAYIPPSSGWVLGEVTETFPTGHLIGWGMRNPAPVSFGLMSMSLGASDEGSEVHYFGLTPLSPGDGNADGKVDGGDLSIWQSNYDPLGRKGATFFAGDWSGDGKVNGADLGLWQQNYSPLAEAEFPYLPDPPIGTHAPEPLTLLGIALGLGSVGAYIRRRRMA